MEGRFYKPLITGASVSADYSTTSPGKRLALRYTPPENIRTIAHPGTPGRLTQAEVTDAVLADRTIVIALDLFFWDSTLPSSSAIPSLESFFARIARRRVPLVIGNVPELLPARQPGREALNTRLRELCRATPGARLVDLEALHQKVLREGFIPHAGRRYTIRELVPDGLHLSAPASDYLADRLLEALG
jgi:hypothetical protein